MSHKEECRENTKKNLVSFKRDELENQVKIFIKK